MRISKEIKRVGYFWLPDSPEQKIPGTLTVLDGGQIHLEIIGTFEGDIFASTTKPIERIIGSTEKVGLVTLDECFYTS